MMKRGLELTRIIPNGRELVQALRVGDCHFRRGVLATLSDAPGDKQPGATLSLPPPMASLRLLAGFDSWHLRHEECPADHFQQVFHEGFIKAVYCLSSAMPAGCS